MKVRKSQVVSGLALASILALVAVGGAIASGGSRPKAERTPTPAESPAGPTDVIHLQGLRGLEFGTSEAELTRQGALLPQTTACGPRLTNLSTVSPIFADDRLVLLWASPPMRTPEGIGVGTALGTLRQAYPKMTSLDAPRGSHRFDGLLVRKGDRAYLFLHDGQRVRKVVAGYADYARKLFDEGFGTC